MILGFRWANAILMTTYLSGLVFLALAYLSLP